MINILRNIRGGSQCGPCQRNTRGRGEVYSHGDGKVPGSSVISRINAVGDARVYTGTIRHYQNKPFLRGSRRGHHLDG